MKFPFMCSFWYLNLNTWREIWYLYVLMYYSLLILYFRCGMAWHFVCPNNYKMPLSTMCITTICFLFPMKLWWLKKRICLSNEALVFSFHLWPFFFCLVFCWYCNFCSKEKNNCFFFFFNPFLHLQESQGRKRCRGKDHNWGEY